MHHSHSGSNDLTRAVGAITFEKTRFLKEGGYCLAAHHAGFNQPIRFTITPSETHAGWQITAWLMTQTCYGDNMWSFPQLEATPLIDQPALEDVLTRVAPAAAKDPQLVATWVYEISSALTRVLRYVKVYDAVGFSWRQAA